MAAIIQTSPRPTAYRPGPVGPARSTRPELRLIQGGRRRATAGEVARRRLVAAVVVVLVAIAVGAAAVAVGRGALAALVPDPPGSSAPATAVASPTPGAEAASVVVRPGDTYWSIARRVQPSGDVRPLVDRLVAGHGQGVLRAGERLVVG